MKRIDWLRANGTNPRVHGNGFIQFDTGPGVRLHIFGHPDVPRQRTPTPIHDHKFGFVSTVLAGSLVNIDWGAESGVPTHFICGYGPSEAGGEDTRLIPTGALVRLQDQCLIVLGPSDSYEIDPCALHETFANEPTVTVIQKTEVRPDYKPRVLCRIGQEPDNVFTRYDLSEAKLWELAEDTFERTGIY